MFVQNAGEVSRLQAATYAAHPVGRTISARAEQERE
jgi:hypothetical protein